MPRLHSCPLYLHWNSEASFSHVLLTGIIVLVSMCCAPAAAPCEVRLGGAIASSGKYATYGQNCVRGWTLWAEKLNSRGGLKLPSGHCTIRLPLDMRDDKSSKVMSATLLESMLDPSSSSFANLDFVIGPASSGITLGNAAVARNYSRILFSHGASESLYNHNNTYIFSSLTPGRKYMSSALTSLHQKGAKSVIFAHESKSFSSSVCEGGEATAISLGMQVLGRFQYASGTSNFASIVYNIKVLNPDVYVGCGHLDDVTYLIGNAKILGVNPKAMVVTHASDARIIGTVGVPYSHGLLSPTQWDKKMAFRDDDGFFGSAMNFYDDYSIRFGAEPSYQSAYSAAMGYALQKAIENAGSISTDKVMMALRAMHLESFYGPLQFSSVGDPSGLVGTQPNRPMITTQLQNATIEVVAPEAAASSSVLYPVPTWSEKALLLYPCDLGYYEDGVLANGDAVCHACPPGQYRDKSLMSCFPCGLGKVANSSAAPTCSSCPAMTSPNVPSGASMCLPCVAGTYCPEGTHIPMACPQGSFCLADHTLPLACPSGAYRNKEGGKNLSDCFACHAGRYSSNAGTIECSACSRGRFTAESGKQTCQRCPLGTYQDVEGSSTCKSCNATFTTLMPSSESADACVCGRGSFFNRAGHICEPCDFSEGVYCPGGNDVPLVKEGYYAELIGDQFMEPGSVSAFSAMYVWECPAPAAILCPGRDVLGKASQSSFAGIGDCNHACLSHLRLHGDCPPHHRGVVCSVCEEGFSMSNGVCRECRFAGLGIFVTAGIVAAMGGALFLYIVCGKPIPKSHTAKLLLASTCGQSVQFIQFVLVLTSFSPNRPPAFEVVSDSFNFLLLDSAPLIKLDCLASPEIRTQYMIRAMFPIVAASAFFSNWAFSRLLSMMTRNRLPTLSFDHSFNTCGLVLMALHVALCKLAVNCFECRPQEAAPDTLVRYPSVLCDSSYHDSLRPMGWWSISVYVLGMLAFVIYTCVRAPARYRSDKTFRCRYNFLISKWRPDRWYWGAVYMSRNALIALVVFVFPRSAFYQTCMMGIFIMGSCILQVHFQPWQNEKSNTMDTCFMVTLLVLLFFSFRYLKLSVADTADSLNVLITTLLVIVGFVSLLCIGYGLKLRIQLEATIAKRNDGIAMLALRFSELKNTLSSMRKDELPKLMVNLSDSDLRGISRALSHLQILHTTKSSVARKSRTFSFRNSIASHPFVRGLNFNPAGKETRVLKSTDLSVWQRASSKLSTIRRASSRLSAVFRPSSNSASSSQRLDSSKHCEPQISSPSMSVEGFGLGSGSVPQLPVLLKSTVHGNEAAQPDCEIVPGDIAREARAFHTKELFVDKGIDQ